MNKTFKNYIFSRQIILVSAIFLLCFIFSTYLHTSLTKDEALNHSKAISNQIFSSMYQVMRKGWSRDDVMMFTKSLEDNFQSSNYEINIYRGDKVKQLFGEIEEKAKDATLVDVLNGKIDKLDSFNNNIVRNILPLKATQDCKSCHVNSQVGDVLGVLEVKQNLNSIFLESKYQFIAFFLIIIPIFYILAFISSRYTTKKITDNLDLFNEKVENINSIQDFKEFDSKNIDLYFKEFNQIINNIDFMAERLKIIAVDKELLEFEIKLLDKFIITSDVVKDWREYICDLLIEINKIMETYTLMTIFRVGEDQFEVDIFWLGIPDNYQKEMFDKYINKTVKEAEYFKEMTDFTIKHIVADNNRCLSELKEDSVEYRTKSLFLDTPKIGGIVGIGLQSVFSNDPVRYIVIDSILTTMANLVGSVKAIHKYTQDLEYYAARDPLTDLFNQRVFNDMMAYEIKRAEKHDYPFALMVIDCDNFKPINDNFGHAFGDKFLQTIADILEEEKRPEDIVARYGGDEFTIILPECDENGALTVANRISKKIEEEKLLAPDGTKVGITISIGISVYPTHSLSQKDMFVIADSMMYQAKEEGKNSIKIPSQNDISNILKQKQEKSSLLIKAIENDQIEAYFQPIKPSSSNNDLVIHELLMRIHQDGKVVSAFEFIEIAEARGLINTMDLMVIEKAFRKIQEIGYEGILFINLSPKSLIMGDFINKINGFVKKYNIKKEKIVFEITERETVKNFSLLEKFVHNLKSEGYKFAIDDFGSGFSSFHYIKKFPIDYVKIDGDFIVNIDKDIKDKAFVNSIVTLAKELKIQVIAEFVENEEIVIVLNELEIDYYQGYHIGKPSSNFVSLQ
ncbi:MAG: GGDEF and EAL domain-containing protein [Arcobacter sp.]|jgi:diguanylate cyclase (GGDEF)-like protein|uniref:Diguanylate cyclase/phosphodiesterase n=1 Tax=Arcobacter defluvii TaxID=873191 RepID=A0AAE7E7V6_9BACT|nr:MULTISPECIES: GGDEF and EAL domain-containing protein [Arcobacter]MDY3200805.1 GGDEF and EAL domain-containing protein [Arcobacter sp.]QKF78094.1 diguanylate cyclase/phosphodiesterase [Arcobacter defluvii]RXI33205.1 GGDEF-domain containing protein [Arcobacter defluvii]BAK73912.1 diguanylate cyclase/phosphodiesterase [Arcobacter sp. L]